MRHEDIARSPVKAFSNLYGQLNLDFTTSVQQTIRKYSKGGEKYKTNGRSGAIQRDSESVIYNWKNRLTSDEIERCRKETSDVAKYFYNEEDW